MVFSLLTLQHKKTKDKIKYGLRGPIPGLNRPDAFSSTGDHKNTNVYMADSKKHCIMPTPRISVSKVRFIESV